MCQKDKAIAKYLIIFQLTSIILQAKCFLNFLINEFISSHFFFGLKLEIGLFEFLTLDEQNHQIFVLRVLKVLSLDSNILFRGWWFGWVMIRNHFDFNVILNDPIVIVFAVLTAVTSATLTCRALTVTAVASTAFATTTVWAAWTVLAAWALFAAWGLSTFIRLVLF